MTNEITIQMTYHAKVERVQRIEAVARIIGITRPVLEYIDYENGKRYQLTTTGIILVLALDQELLITAFMATYEQAHKLYSLVGKKRVAPKMEKKINKNLEKYSYLLYI